MNRAVQLATVLTIATIGMAWEANAEEFHANLTGFREVPLAILSDGTGKLTLKLDKNAQSISYTLTYSGLSSDALQAHIHFGKEHVVGGIFAFLCTNLGNGPAGTPACPTGGGTVSGLITAASVIALPAQNLPAGSFDSAVRVLNSGTVYGNVHTTKFPAGEIRGEVKND